jgi:hypothetical protein
MVANFPGPMELRINYSVTISTISVPHTQRLNLKDFSGSNPSPGTPFSSINTADVNGTSVNLQTLVDEWIAILQGLYANTCTWSDAELWGYNEGTNDAYFISAYTLGLSGTAGGSNLAAAQSMITFRTQEGGILRVNLMENMLASTQPIPYASMTAAEKALVDFIVDSSGRRCFLGRDTSYPFSVIKWFPGQNEALARKRFRIGE